ncbi:YcnI family protein [Nonomuraea salmonea]|uniref:YcnI family copper-binding membrane protein n=1 Tax=Nonomuraea salmonea TaxID=46181 RepID=UPI002FE800DB
MSFVRRSVTVLAAATALTAGLALPALAHVTIQPGSAEQGGFTKVAFRVPNERDNASTTKIEVSFPTDHPLAFVSVKPVPGWDVKVTEGKLPKPVTTEYGELDEAVTKVVWSGGKVEPGQFQEFEVSMGKLPEGVDSLMFPTKQTYSNGEVVDWSEAPKADGSEAEHPAPLLKLTPAAAAANGTAGTTTPATAPRHRSGRRRAVGGGGGGLRRDVRRDGAAARRGRAGGRRDRPRGRLPRPAPPPVRLIS